MFKKLLSTVLSVSMIAGGTAAIMSNTTAMAESQARIVEYLDRGLVAVRVEGGVYLSWRLLGTEAADTTFDIYRNGKKIEEGYSNTNYTDTNGFDTDTYKVVVSGESTANEKATEVWNSNYLEVPIVKPTPDPANDKAGTDYTYQANDAAVADLDGDGEYEIVLKWDPTNSQDNYYAGYTGNVYIDAYEMDGTHMWRIDMGVNIRAGAHYTQFIVYDFDSDGKAELAVKTAPGTKDAKGNFVSTKAAKLGDEEFIQGDDTKDYRTSDGRVPSQPDWVTMFNGETGEAMQTVNHFKQRGSLSGQDDGSGWGGTSSDSGSNYADRHLAGVAYLNGRTPSLILGRGYYFRSAIGAYDWDGENFSLRWSRDDGTWEKDGLPTMYKAGAHSLSVADVDNDGFDEVIYGSAVVDHDGSVLHNTKRGHGDALHVNDFNNDGKQEIFMVLESNSVGAYLRDGVTGESISDVYCSDDVGRGVMGNIIASNEGSEFWSNANGNLYDDEGKVINSSKPAEVNFLSWWDGDLTREVLDQTRIVKYDIDENGKLVSERLANFVGTHSNNTTKATPSLSADIFGDWREEVMLPTSDDNNLRIYTTTIPTEYKMATLMHDTQYRCAIGWQNVGYNQPPHPSFYVGEEKTEYPQPDVELASVPQEDTTPTPMPEEELVDILPTKTFANSTESWQGEMVNDVSPYGNVLSLADGQINSLINRQCVKITATYDDNGALENVSVTQADISEAHPSEDGNTKIMYWDSLDGMKPVTAPQDADVYQLNLMWKPIASGSELNILDENGSNIFSLVKPDGAVMYKAGSGEAELIDSTLSKNDWYSVSITVDTVSKLIDCRIKDYSATGTTEKSVCGISYDGNGTDVASIKSTGSNYIDNVHLSAVKYNVEMHTVTFDVSDSEGAVAGAEITIDGKTVVSDSNGHAAMLIKNSAEYDMTVQKAGYKTYTAQISDDSNSIVLEKGVQNNIYIAYKNTNGDEIADAVLAGTALDNTSYTVLEDSLSDITADNGVIYEFDADATEGLTKNIEGETTITLIYKEKITPTTSDKDALRVVFGKNSVGTSSWESNLTPEYKTSSKGVKYGLFSNIGNDYITVNLPSALGDSYIIEYDMYISDIESENTFAMIPYADETALSNISMSANGDNITLVKPDGTACTYSSEDYKNSAYVKGNMLHAVIMYKDGSAKVSLINRDTGVVYVDNQDFGNIGTGITKLVFARTAGNGICSVGLGELKAYTVGGPTHATWTFGDEINLTAPSEASIAPVYCEHGADYGSAVMDMKSGLTYSLTDAEGNAVSDENVVLDEAGNITVSEAATPNTYYVQIMYDGNVFRTVPVNVLTGITESFWKENFEGETHKFNLITSGGLEYWSEDGATVNKAEGKIYGVGARSGGNTASISDEIDTSGYNDVAVNLNFRMDACADQATSYISLLAAENTSNGVNSETEGQILTISAKANGNGTWNEIYVNGEDITAAANVSKGTSNGENGGVSFRRDTTGWLHLYVLPDFEKQTSQVLITRISDNSIVYSGELDFVTQADSLKYVYVSGGKQYSATWLDNIEISGIDPDGVKLESISVTAPTVTEYEIGKALDTTGMIVTGHYADGSEKEITDYTISGFDSSVAGNCTVTIEYKGKTATFDVSIFEVQLPEGVLYQNNFEGAAFGILTSNRTDRYVSELAEENGNTYEKVSVIGDGGNGAFITTEAFTADEGTDYTLSFDMALTPTSGNYVQSNYWILRSKADDCEGEAIEDYIFRLTQASANKSASANTVYYINDDTADTVTLDVDTWYSYTIDCVENVVYLTIKDAEGNDVVARKEIASKTVNGGLNGIYYATKRYSAGMKIDNIVLKEYTDSQSE